MENTKVYVINGYDDEGYWDIEVYSTYEKARNRFNEYVEDFAKMYNCNVNVDENFADYDADNHYGNFWIESHFTL